MANVTKVTPTKRDGFLHALSMGSTVTAAARAAGVTRKTMYEHKRADEEFSVAWDEAYQEGIDTLEEEAKRRAVHGVTKPVFYQGDIVGQIQEYSDTLLMFTLKSRDRDRYSDKSETKHTVGGSLEQLIIESMKPDEPGK